MKIKPKNYSLIGNELIDELDVLLDRLIDFAQDKDYLDITDMKSKIYQLIPAEKLADVCFEAGEKRGYEIPALQMRMIKLSEAENPNKQDFLNSEIQIQ
jgi:hypothetical protein